MTKLGVNIDHVATIRQARLTPYPDIVAAALAAERGGAAGITAHLREDRRHIQDADIVRLRDEIDTKLNLEMAATREMAAIACRVRPADVCVVPERRQELTTEGGLDAAGKLSHLRPIVSELRGAGIRVSLFIDPEISQVDAAASLSCEVVELHTGKYADAQPEPRRRELERLQKAAAHARSIGVVVNAGHGLTRDNVGAIAAIPLMHELNIGHSIVADAIFFGLEEAVKRMKAAIVAAARP